MTDSIAEQIANMGYEPVQTSTEQGSDGNTGNTWSVLGFHPLLNKDGTRRDYAPALNVASITLEYASWRGWPETFSPVAARFADALVALLAPVADPKPRGILRRREEPKARPLVRRTATSLQLVYRIDGVAAELRDPTLHWRPVLYPHGLAASDQSATLTLTAGLPNIPVGDDATWVDLRSPLTVHRDALPPWDGESASAAVAGLVEQWVAAGELSVCGRYQEPAKPEGYYSPEAALARDGVKIGLAVDEWTGRSPGDLGRERGRWG